MKISAKLPKIIKVCECFDKIQLKIYSPLYVLQTIIFKGLSYGSFSDMLIQFRSLIFIYNYFRISGMIEKLCDTYGTHLLRHEEVSHYNFPTIEALADREVEAKLRVLGFGYRAKFIQQSAAKIVENGGREWLLNLRTLPYNEAKTALMTLPGIGAKVSYISTTCYKLFIMKNNCIFSLKVADCICLMSLNHACAIPVDTHVFQIAKSTYMPHLKATKSVTDRGYNEISTFFQNLYGPYAGWAHSVCICIFFFIET